MLVYFAHPIDQVANARTNKIADDIHQSLSVAGLSVFRPGTAYTMSRAHGWDGGTVDRINQHALRESDAVVAWLPHRVATLGVPAEIEQALRTDKPVMILTDDQIVHNSVQMFNWKERGAAVEVWSEELARSWESQPDRIVGQLLTAYEDATDDYSFTKEPHELLDISTFDSGPMSMPGKPITAANTPQLLVRYGPGATALSRHHKTDAGFDIATNEDAVLHSGERTLISTGVYGAVPDGWYGRLTGRSSALHRWNIQVHEGIIDAGYLGELKISATYQGLGHLDVEAGTRLAQYILQPVFDGEVVEVDRLPETARGTNGWGSSGK